MLNNIIDNDRREIINDVMKTSRYEWYSTFMKYKNIWMISFFSFFLMQRLVFKI